MDDLFFNRIDDFVYGECSEQEFSEFKKHMESCEKCKEEYELAVSLKHAVSSMPKITPPADFSEMLNKRLDNELSKSVKISPSVYRKYSAVAACVALVAILGIDSAKLTDDAFKVPFDTLPVSSVPDSYINNSSESSLQEDIIAEIPPIPTENIQKASTNKPTSEKVSVPKSEIIKPDYIQEDKKDMSESEKKFVTVYSNKETANVSHETIQTPKQYISETVVASGQEQPVVHFEPVTHDKPVVQDKTVQKSNADTNNDSNDSVYINNEIPQYMDPRENVVLASTVEKEYQIKAIKPEDIPVKQRDLQAEFALLENPKTGNIIANPATLASLEGVQIKEIKSNGTGAHEYGIGSGSIFISSEDQDTVNELLNKYQSQEDHSVYYFTGENFDSFTNELEDNGIDYEKRLISQDGSNVAFKVVAS